MVLFADKNPMLFLNVETTGGDCYSNMITKVNAALYVNGVVTETFSSDLKAVPSPQKRIDLDSLFQKNEKLSDTMKEGVEEAEGLINFVDWLVEVGAGGAVVGGYNVHHDLGFIKTTLINYNITGWEQAISSEVEDVSILARTMSKVGLIPSTNSLESLGEHFDLAPLTISRHKLSLNIEVYNKLLNVLENKNDI